MQVAHNQVVSLNYTLTNDSGEIIDQCSDGSFCYLHGNSNIIKGLENALTGKTVGDEFSVQIDPADAYGEHDSERIQKVPRDAFPADTEIAPNMQFHAEGPDGQQIVVMVTEVNDSEVTVDGNHPLAGVRLNFQIKVMDVRAASEEEIAHGHVHGPHGHSHD